MRRKSTLFVLALLGYCLTHCTSGLLLKETESLPAKLAQVTIRIRRDTSAGIPVESVHSLGLSQIVWGEAPPGTRLTISLQRDHALLSVRQIVVPRNGFFAISLDRFIEDGDKIIVSDGTAWKIIEVPVMRYRVDTRERVIRGTAPANIQSRVRNSPHSLQISIGGLSLQMTTTREGDFVAGFQNINSTFAVT